jgi:all-trans-retinol dehydrogenase (NAD+)
MIRRSSILLKRYPNFKFVFRNFASQFGQPQVKSYWKTKLFACVFSGYLLYQTAKCYGFLPKKSIANDVIFLTGGGSGLGKLVSFLLGEKGGKIIIADINGEAAASTAAELQKKGFDALGLYCDVTNPESVKKAVVAGREKYGPITMLINNAGIVNGKALLDLELKEIRRTFDVNLYAPFVTTKEVLPDMIKAGRGHIVTIGSGSAYVGLAKLSDYISSKAGAVGFTESLRTELKQTHPFIRTTLICPYIVDTGLFQGAQGTKSYFRWFLPVLKQRNVAKRIMYSILQNEEQVISPAHINSIFLLKAFCTPAMFDYIFQITGFSTLMNEFIGRKPQ